MSSSLFHQFQSYLDIADNYRQNPGLYLLIKNYAIKKLSYFASKDQNFLNPNERTFLNNTIEKFRGEFNANPLAKDEYTKFLEKFFDGINFDQAGYRQLEICKDLCEVMYEFGDVEDLWVKRSN